jgi:hypothetical protein
MADAIDAARKAEKPWETKRLVIASGLQGTPNKSVSSDANEDSL